MKNSACPEAGGKNVAMMWIAPETDDLAPYLRSDSIVEAGSPAIAELAQRLRAATASTAEHDFIRAAFDWVRDQILHSFDARDPRVTLTATEVLTHRVGLCYAKSHLLAALLRSEGVPAGFCYQRLETETGHVVHGLVAVYSGGHWHRLDPRGNNERVTSSFDLEHEKLAYKTDPTLGEIDYPGVYAAPAAEVVSALGTGRDALAMPLPAGLVAPSVS